MRALAALVVVVTLGQAWPALACSCLLPDFVWPLDGDIYVVRDARIWMSYDRGDSTDWFALLDADDRIVDGRWAVVDVHRWPFAYFAPTEPLAVNGVYALREFGQPVAELAPEDLRDRGHTLTTFTVAGSLAPRSAAPRATLTGASAVATNSTDPGGGNCELSSHGVAVAVTFDVQRDDAALFVVALRDAVGLPTTLGSAELAAITSADELLIGTHLCGAFWNAQAGDVSQFRFASVDVKGRLSEWTEPIEVALPGGRVDDDDDSAGCATTPLAPFSFALIALLARRRQRARSTARRAASRPAAIRLFRDL